MKESVFVNPESCDCRKRSKRECLRIVLETSSKLIDLRRSTASQSSGKGLYTWDLARFRIPRHPEYEAVEVLPKVKYLNVSFNTIAGQSQPTKSCSSQQFKYADTNVEKEEFLLELKSLERVRDLENKIYRNLLMESTRRDRRPERR